MNEPGVFGPCAEWEHEIVELADGALAPERGAALQAHLRSCARCRDWRSAWLAVDARLAATLPHPAPSPGFDGALLARIAALTERDRGLLRVAAEQEYAWLSNSLHRGLGLRIVGNALATATVAGTGVWLALGWLEPWLDRLLSMPTGQRSTLIGGFAVTCVVAALAQSVRARS